MRFAILSLLLLAPSADGSDLTPEAAWTKARVEGKYRFLLRRIEAAEDRATIGEFADRGDRPPLERLAGSKEMPDGHWVYVFPHWYVWRDLANPQAPKASHSPAQATGKPDTPVAADAQTAWASNTPDGQDEWLTLEYDEPVVPTAVKIYESFSPGAVSQVSLFDIDGTETVAWSGKDPTPNDLGLGVFVVPVKHAKPVTRVKIALKSAAVPNWNEIDAVGLVGSSGKTQWAAAAEASSTFGQPNGQAQAFIKQVGLTPGGTTTVTTMQVAPTAPAPAVVPSNRIKTLEATVNQLSTELQKARLEMEEMKRRLEEVGAAKKK